MRKGIVISLYVSQEEYDRAMEDMNYAYDLLNEYEKNHLVKQTDVVPANTNYSQPSEAQSQNSTLSESQNEDGSWSHEETKLLISLYGQHKEDFSHAKKKKHVWDIIAEKMNSYNYNRSAAKIERKWINLLRVYRSIKDNKGPKKTGRGSQNYKFFDDLDEILGDKPSNNNRFCVEVGIIRDSTNIENQSLSVAEAEDTPSTSHHASEVSSDVSSASTTDINITPSAHKRKRKFSAASQSEQYLQAKMKRHEERMAVEREKIQLERQKIGLLKLFLENQERNGN